MRAVAIVISIIALMLATLSIVLQSNTSRQLQQVASDQRDLEEQMETQSTRLAEVESDVKQNTEATRATQNEVASLGSSLQDLRDSVLEETLNAEAAELARKATYLVIATDGKGETPVGTAWVVRDSVLATNAHVARVSQLLDPAKNQRLILKNRTSFHDVLEIRMHRGHKVFADTVDDYKPLLRGAAGWQSVRIFGGYDVALMYVTNAEQLPPPLPVASPETLASLSQLQPLFMVGFPLAGTQSATIESLSLNPRASRGTVLATAPYIPKHPDETDSDELKKTEYFVLHDLFAAPGNSGSPMLNAKGEVVAILSHGFGGSGTGEKGAQRADILLELLDQQDITRVREFHSPRWRRRLSQFEQADRVVRRELEAYVRSQVNGVQIVSHTLNHGSFDERVREFTFQQAKADVDGNTSVTTTTVGVPGYHYPARLSLPAAQDHLLYTFDYRNDGAPCYVDALRQFQGGWRKTARQISREVLQIQGLYVFFTFIQGDSFGPSTEQIVFWQDPRCSQSHNFTYGVISYNEPIVQSPEQEVSRLDDLQRWITGWVDYIEALAE